MTDPDVVHGQARVRGTRIPVSVVLVRLEVDVTDRTVTILACRPPWRPEYGPDWTRFPIARLRYTKSRNRWSLYGRDRNLEFHEYDLADPTPDIQELLDEIDRDPTSIFWG